MASLRSSCVPRLLESARALPHPEGLGEITVIEIIHPGVIFPQIRAHASELFSKLSRIPCHFYDINKVLYGHILTSVSRWNVIGVQGSLLSYFTEPVYFSSLILGSLYHADHLSRAMYQRIADIDDLAQPFHINKPLLSGISNTEARQPGKAPNFSVNWTVGDQGLEIINATTGKDDLGRPSHLCKHALYSRWVCLHAKLTETLRIGGSRPSSYHEAKQAATEYHTAKQNLFKAFYKAGLGAWVEKPSEQDQFSLNT